MSKSVIKFPPFIWGILFVFSSNLPAVGAIHESPVFLPKPGIMVHLSPAFNPPVLKGIKVHPDNPFRFDFILDQGSLPLVGRAREGELKQESIKLIKYFLASLTIPEQDLWVNLSPYEKDRIVPNEFGQTEMGRDLLAQDYLLKQITASLIYPENDLGKEFWKKVYAQAQTKFGTTNIPVNTFNKVWIVPDKAVVYENGGAAFVLENHLKVLLEEDYVAISKNIVFRGDDKGARSLGSQIIREIIIPALTKEVNEGKNFARLRQVFYSLILATWYKKKIKDSILNKVYSNQKKINNLSSPQTSIGDPQYIYQQYLQAFKKGAYNYIKEEPDPTTGQPIPRKYFSGGVNAKLINPAMRIIDPKQIDQAQKTALNNMDLINVTTDFAMLTKVNDGRIESTVSNKTVFNRAERGLQAPSTFISGLVRAIKWRLLGALVLSASGNNFLNRYDLNKLNNADVWEEITRILTSPLYFSFDYDKLLLGKGIQTKQDLDFLLSKMSSFLDAPEMIAWAIQRGIISSEQEVIDYLKTHMDSMLIFSMPILKHEILVTAKGKNLWSQDIDFDQILEDHVSGPMNIYASLVYRAVNSGLVKDESNLRGYLKRMQMVRGIMGWYPMIIELAVRKNIITSDSILEFYLEQISNAKVSMAYAPIRSRYARILIAAKQMGIKKGIDLDPHLEELIKMNAWSEYANVVIDAIQTKFITNATDLNPYLKKIEFMTDIGPQRAKVLIEIIANKFKLISFFPDVLSLLSEIKSSAEKGDTQWYEEYVELIVVAVDAGMPFPSFLLEELRRFCAFDYKKKDAPDRETESEKGNEEFKSNGYEEDYVSTFGWDIWQRNGQYGDNSLYKILGVSPDIEQNDLKKVYWTLARKYHPDTLPAEEKKEGEEKFKLIGGAYEVLSDQSLRKSYDSFLCSKSASDSALITKGGIDFNPAQMTLQVKQGGYVKNENISRIFNIDPAKVIGLSFTIRQMAPVNDISVFLGLPN